MISEGMPPFVSTGRALRHRPSDWPRQLPRLVAEHKLVEFRR
jgi:hypothetical protein